MKSKPIKAITYGAICIALATVLSLIKVFTLPNGGSITAVSMAPIIIFALMFDLKWGVMAAVVYSGIQMMIAFYPPPTQDFLSFTLVVLLDYVIAFGVLSLSKVFAAPLKSFRTKLIFGGGIAMILRFLSHFASGIIIWNVYAPPGENPVIYSLLYNGSYMLGEFVLTIVALTLLASPIQKMTNKMQ